MKLHQIKNIFFNLIDEHAMKLIAKKVSKINGDIRIAFDLMKSALTKLQTKIKYNTTHEVSDIEVRVTKEIIN
jgi:Cdc6-like AAA superfamily ATPase